MRKVISAFLALCLALSLAVPSLAAQAVPSVLIDGEAVAFTDSSGAPFIDENDRTLVPLRLTMETYGCEVYWDNENRRAVVYRDGVSFVCPIGENYVEINGVYQEIDTAAVIVDDRTYLPIRCVLEAFGAAVGWDGSTRSVAVGRGITDATLHQDEALERVLAAVSGNTMLSAKDAGMIKKAVTEYLSNIEVDSGFVDKMCSRLSTLRVEQEAMTDYSGYVTTENGFSYVIRVNTLGEVPVTTDEEYYIVLFHELCHLFSEIVYTSTWFQEGMTMIFETDMTDESLMLAGAYDVYYQTCATLCELFGGETMLEAYLNGDEESIYYYLDLYSGASNSKRLFNAAMETMNLALIGSFYAGMTGDTYDGASKEEWASLYSQSAEKVVRRISNAYAGLYDLDIKSDPLMCMYIDIIENCAFFSTSYIMATPTIENKNDLCFFDRSQLKYFYVMSDPELAFSDDGEIIYYRY